jgi:hypothetical protein
LEWDVSSGCAGCVAWGEFASHSKLLLGDPDTQNDKIPDDEENDNGRNQDSQDVAGNNTRRVLLEVEKRVYVKAFSGVGNVCQAKV